MDAGMLPETENDVLVFRINHFWKGFFCIGSPLLLGLMGYGFFQVIDVTGRIIMGITFACFAWLFVYCVSLAIRSHIEIGLEEIHYIEAFTTKVFALDELEGFKILPTQYIKTLVLIPKSSRPKKVKIPLYFQHNAELLASLEERIPNLDKAEFIVGLQEIYKERNLGETPEEKAENLTRIKKWCRWITLGSAGTGLWALFLPRPYEAAIWAQFIWPFVGLFMLGRFKGIVRYNVGRNSAYPGVDTAFILPSLALMGRAFLDWHILGWDRVWPLLATLGIGGGFFWICMVRELRRKILNVFLFLLFWGIGTFGAIITLNGILASAPVSCLHAQIRAKHMTEGKSTIYYLTLSPWGKRQSNEDVTVSRQVYSQYQPGDTAEILVRTGKLGIPFYLVR